MPLVFEPRVILLILGVGACHSTLKLVCILSIRVAIEVILEQRVTRSLPLLRPPQRVAVPLLIVGELPLLG